MTKLSLVRVLILGVAWAGFCTLAGCSKVSKVQDYNLKTSQSTDPKARLDDALDDLDNQRDTHLKQLGPGKTDADDKAFFAVLDQANAECEQALIAKGETPEAAKSMANEWAVAQENRHHAREMERRSR